LLFYNTIILAAIDSSVLMVPKGESAKYVTFLVLAWKSSIHLVWILTR